MTKKIYYNWKQVEGACSDIIRQLCKSKWRPDYIVGISRGGLIPATLISHYLEIPMKPLAVNLRDHQECTSDCSMAEDAFGYVSSELESYKENSLVDKKKILIVDDINDTGATFEWIKKDWANSCFPTHESWLTTWHNTVRFAALVNNASSKQPIDYYCWDVNKSYENCWVIFPWEDWHCKDS